MKNKRRIKGIQRRLGRIIHKLTLLELDRVYMRLPNFKYVQEKKDLLRRQEFLRTKLTALQTKDK